MRAPTIRKSESILQIVDREPRPDYVGLAEVLTRAFGVPAVQTEVLRDVSGITVAYIYGSWAARHADLRPERDIDVIVLGDPDRDQLYAAPGTAEPGRCRPQSATTPGWSQDPAPFTTPCMPDPAQAVPAG